MKAAIGTKWNPGHAIERRDGVFSERNPQMSRFDIALQRALLRCPVVQTEAQANRQATKAVERPF